MTTARLDLLPGSSLGQAVRQVEALLVEAGLEMPRIEAGMLVAMAVGTDRVGLLMAPDRPLAATELEVLRGLCARRLAREPMAYLAGWREFHGLRLTVTPDVLVPRPETELLVEFAVAYCAGLSEPRVLDVGTGSGCIAAAIATAVPTARILAVDLSGGAVGVASLNSRQLGVNGQVLVARVDLLSAIPRSTFDIIVSNPPYIPTVEMESLQPEVGVYEPRCALDGGGDGLDFYRRLVAEGPGALNPGGWMAVEVGMGQAGDVSRMMAGAGFSHVTVQADLAGIDRVVAGRR